MRKYLFVVCLVIIEGYLLLLNKLHINGRFVWRSKNRYAGQLLSLGLRRKVRMYLGRHTGVHSAIQRYVIPKQAANLRDRPPPRRESSTNTTLTLTLTLTLAIH